MGTSKTARLKAMVEALPADEIQALESLGVIKDGLFAYQAVGTLKKATTEATGTKPVNLGVIRATVTLRTPTGEETPQSISIFLKKLPWNQTVKAQSDRFSKRKQPRTMQDGTVRKYWVDFVPPLPAGPYRKGWRSFLALLPEYLAADGVI